MSSNKIRYVTKDNVYKGWGENPVGILNPFTSFRWRHPSIICDIVQRNLNDSDICKEIEENAHKGIYFVESTQKQKYLLWDDEGNSSPIEFLRYLVGLNTGLHLFQEFRDGPRVVTHSIIPLNSFSELSKFKISAKFYKDLAYPFFVSDKFFKSLVPVTPTKNYFFDQNLLKSSLNSNFSSLALLPNMYSFFVLDIDDPTLFPVAIKDYLFRMLNRYAISYHGFKSESAKTVIYKQRFKVILKSSYSIWDKLNILILAYRAIKVEIAFSKGFTLFGVHRSGASVYHFLGADLLNTCIPSQELMDLLYFHVPTRLLSESSDNERYYSLQNVSYNWAKDKLKEFQGLYGGSYKLLTDEFKLKLKGACPNKSLHTKRAQNTDFSITYNILSKSIIGSCFHESCARANYELLKDFFEDSNSNENLSRESTNKQIQNKTGHATHNKALIIKPLNKYEMLKQKLNVLLGRLGKHKTNIDHLRANIGYYESKVIEVTDENLGTRSRKRNNKRNNDAKCVPTSARCDTLKEELNVLLAIPKGDRSGEQKKQINKLRANIRYYETLRGNKG